jgi:signal transduction histidine kinase
VSATYEQPVNFTMNPILTDILLNNLFSNAIKYNLPGGNIAITADENTLSFTNTGAAAALDESRLFRRFSKQGSAKEGIGLGLAIIRQVAEVSGFGIHYHYQDQQHHFVLQKNVL